MTIAGSPELGGISIPGSPELGGRPLIDSQELGGNSVMMSPGAILAQNQHRRDASNPSIRHVVEAPANESSVNRISADAPQHSLGLALSGLDSGVSSETHSRHVSSTSDRPMGNDVSPESMSARHRFSGWLSPENALAGGWRNEPEDPDVSK